MQIYKVINVDIEGERKRIQKVKYSKKEKKALLNTLDLFESGDFQGAIKAINKWGNRNWLEYLDEDIWGTLHQASIGHQFYKAPAPILKKGTKVVIKASGNAPPWAKVFDLSIGRVRKGATGVIRGPTYITYPWELEAYDVELDKPIAIPNSTFTTTRISIKKQFVVEKVKF